MEPATAAAIAHPEVDGTDPLVVVIAWALTYAAGRWAPWLQSQRRLLPTLSVLLAVAARAALDATTGEPLTMDTLARGLAAGATAVLAHSQVRELQKAAEEPSDAE
jgi:hypothetical protein